MLDLELSSSCRPACLVARLLLVSCGIAGPIVAQTVIQVPLVADLQPIVNAASPGDVLQLSDTNYARFTLDKGLTIVGPATFFSVAPQIRPMTIDVPAGQVARFVDLEFRPDVAFTFNGVHNIRITGAGTVVFEDCRISGVPTVPGGGSIEIEGGGNVVFTRTLVQGVGSGNALVARDAAITATGSRFEGALPSFIPMVSHGILATGSGSLHLASVSVTGSPGSAVIAPGTAAAAIRTEVETWIVDSTVQGGEGSVTTPGAPGIEATVPIMVTRSTVAGGLGSTGTAPPVVGNGGALVLSPELIGVEVLTPLSLGASATVRWSGRTQASAVTIVPILVRGPLAAIDLLPLVRQPLWFSRGIALAPLSLSLFSGTADMVLQVPNDPALRYQAFDLVGLRLFNGTILATPAAASTLR